MRDYRFGNFIHELREQRCLSQYQLGMLVGVSDKAVSKWENGSSKPQSRILYRLGEVLGVTVDELLSGQYGTSENKDTNIDPARKKELWQNAFQALRDRYGEVIPIEILSRYLSEYGELQYSDWIIYFDLLSRIHTRARSMGESIRIQGGIGASFVAFVMGATEINPLNPHYYCPCCRKLEFAANVRCGWDLPHRRCTCGQEMERDGHNLPFETLLPALHRRTHFELSISHGMYETVKDIVSTCLADNTVITMSKKGHPDLKTMVIVNRKIPNVTSGQELMYEEYHDHFKKYPTLTLLLSEELDALRLLEKDTQTTLRDIPFTAQEILDAFCENNTQGIPEFGTDFVMKMIKDTSPHSFHDLIQLLGLAHGTGTWVGMEIAYRDDIFHHLRNKLAERGIFDTGFACNIMENTCHGLYAKNGISAEIKQYFSAIGIENRFVDSIEKIQYIFPKAQGIHSVKLASLLMWYKLHYPESYKKIIKAV